MKFITQILCLCWLFPSILTGQFQDNFSDGNLTDDPTWQGDITNFKVNDIGQLQLETEGAGESSLFIPISITEDFTWKMDVALDFAPSNNNRVQVFFFITDEDPSVANGYYFDYGENLAEDNLKFYRLDAGVETLLGEGELGALADKPADLSIQIDRVDGLWTISTDYEKQGFPVEEFLFMDDTYESETSGFFKLFSKYTSSNADAFVFDNILGETFVPDTEGPNYINFELTSDNSLLVRFDEAIESSSLGELNLSISPDNSVNSVEIVGALMNELDIQFATSFESGPTYTVELSGLTDVLSNLMPPASFNFVIPVLPSEGDIVINEILFDPLVGGVDFVELINRSDHILSIQDLVLFNSTKEGSEEVISANVSLLPGAVIAITSDSSQTKSTYLPPSSARFLETKIPSFNKDEGNVSLLDLSGNVLDSYDYTEDQHISLLDETKGVSLERIFPNGPSTSENFSSGVQSTNYATPGYVNANYRDEGSLNADVFSLETSVFSPNEDGDKDQLIMFIKLPDAGYLSTIRIFNINGQLVRLLQNNQITGKEDIARWDGEMDDGGRAAIGHYIIEFQAFRDNGDVIRSRKHVKLLDFLH